MLTGIDIRHSQTDLQMIKAIDIAEHNENIVIPRSLIRAFASLISLVHKWSSTES